MQYSKNDIIKKTKFVLEEFDWNDELFIKFKE